MRSQSRSKRESAVAEPRSRHAVKLLACHADAGNVVRRGQEFGLRPEGGLEAIEAYLVTKAVTVMSV